MLTQNPDRPECWERDGFEDGSGGLYAFIVGVSAYPWLKAGAQYPGYDPLELNLGQLYSSAHSAYRFHRCLQERYAFEDSPLVKAWLYLAPTEAERQRIDTSTADPSLEALTLGLRDWHGALQRAASGLRADHCRALFFFSGHGIEVDNERQILLPSDFGRVADNPELSVGTDNVHTAVSSTGTPWSLFLIDSCRSDNELLRLFQSIEGQRIFPSAKRDHKPRGSAPIIYASASGSKAYQYNTLDRNDGLTLFTSAVVDGLSLSGPNPPKPDCSTRPCVVRVSDFYQWLNARMTDLYAAASIAEPDPVVQGGRLRGAMPLLHVDAHDEDAGTATKSAATDFRAYLTIERPNIPLLDQGSFGSLATLQARGSYAGDAERLETALGSWPVRKFVFDAKFHQYHMDEWLPRSPDYDITRIKRTAAGDFARVTFTTGERDWRYIEADNRGWTYGFLIPALPASTLLELEIVYDEPVIRRASFFISPANKGSLGELGTIWRINRSNGAPAALAAHRNAFPQLAKAAMNPLVDLVAALLAIGSGDRDSARASISRLLTQSYSSDAAVLLMQLDLEEGAAEPSRAQLSAYLGVLARWGIPATAAATGHLLAQLAALRQTEAFRAVLDKTDDRRRILWSLLSRLDQLRKNYRATGFFSSFATSAHRPLGMAPVAA